MTKIAEDVESKKYVVDRHLGGGDSSNTSPVSNPRRRPNQSSFPSTSGLRGLNGTPNSETPNLTGSPMTSSTRARMREMQNRTRRERQAELKKALEMILQQFEESLPEPIRQGDELDQEVDDLLRHPRRAKYSEIVKKHAIFTL